MRAAAEELLSWTHVPTIDIVVNNAAMMNIPERQLSAEGVEIQFATNHLGHFLFTNLIMPKLVKAAAGSCTKGATRIINVTSLSPMRSQMRWSDINQEKLNKDLPLAEQPDYSMHRLFGEVDPEEKSYLALEGYNQSKVANVLFSIGLNQRLYEKHGILSFAGHPGVIITELSRSASAESIAAIQKFLTDACFHVKTLGGGAATSLLMATDPKLGLPTAKTADGKENLGVYFMDCQISDQAAPGASSSCEADRLWKLSEELVKEQFEL